MDSPEHQEGGQLPSLLTMKVDVPPDVKPQELRLPQALEQALAFKSERAKQLGVVVSEDATPGKFNKLIFSNVLYSVNVREIYVYLEISNIPESDSPPGTQNDFEEEEAEAEAEEAPPVITQKSTNEKPSKNKRKKKRKKRNRQLELEKQENRKNEEKDKEKEKDKENQKDKDAEPDVEVE